MPDLPRLPTADEFAAGTSLKLGNNWFADSFEQWLEVVAATLKPPPGHGAQ